MNEVQTEVRGCAGLITLNRPKALNALSLDMIRALTTTLLAWRGDAQVEFVAIRGMGKEGAFGAFCAGGDIRFFHQAALAGDPRLEDFFTEEYALNHLIHHYPKPYVAFLDGIVMGGGMGIAGHGGINSLRVATERTKMAMPETNIGLFPDVGGGWFLGRAPGHIGEYLALTGHAIGGEDAREAWLADGVLPSGELGAVWAQLTSGDASGVDRPRERLGTEEPAPPHLEPRRASIDRIFGLPTVADILTALDAEAGEWARTTAEVLRKRSPLMLHVVLKQIRLAREMPLADDLRMERDMVRNCFHLRPGAASETVEGIRALAVDKDHQPRWNPASLGDVSAALVDQYFASPWPAHAHPLRSLR